MKKLIFCFIIFACLSCSGDEQETSPSQMQLDSLRTTLEDREHKVDSLQKVIDAKRADNPWFNASLEGRFLLKQGVENPEAHIEQSLRQKPELIFLKPVLGGTMRFTNIQVLGNQWIIAEYEDGHIMGRTIYEYRIKPDGSIRFTELASTPQGN